VFTSKYITSHCKHHNETIFIYEESKKGYRCKKCRSGRVTQERRNLKEKLIQSLGGKCVRCGYSEFIGALDFDHIDPTKKSFDVA
jgi:transposase-like protein